MNYQWQQPFQTIIDMIECPDCHWWYCQGTEHKCEHKEEVSKSVTS